jgi:hypothetical protein
MFRRYTTAEEARAFVAEVAHPEATAPRNRRTFPPSAGDPNDN